MRLLLALLVALPLTAGVKVQQRTPAGPVIVEFELERYVAAALAGESGVFQSAEALKAMAIAVRSYAVHQRGRHSDAGFDFCDTTHCQRLDFNAITGRVESAAGETTGDLVWFQGKLAFTPYSADCGGRSESAAAVWPDLGAPYLKSRDDPYCPRDAWRWSGAPEEIAAALRRAGLRAPRTVDGVAIPDRTASGRARTLRLTGGGESVRVSASSFRFALGREIGWNTIRSERYEVSAANGRVHFEGFGAGHGVGLCQRGADRMGQTGSSYREILAHYYPGTVTGLTGRGIAWQRLSGDTVRLLTTRPDRDRRVLAIAERAVRTLSQRTGWPAPPEIEIRAYPDVETFRNATAEPGWVAARTDGRRIHLQPVPVLDSRGVLQSTVAHELLHVLMESQAAPGLPVWFREGLAGYLERRVTAGGTPGAGTALRQRADAPAARKGYAEAAAAVSSLVNRYGETAVFSWLKRGLPPEVTKASASQPATKSR